MGYRRKTKRIEVRLDGEYDGFEATLRGSNLGEFLALLGIGEVDMSDVSDQLKRMDECLISWNLEDEETGEPVPVVPGVVFNEDQDLMLKLAAMWIDSLKGIKAPLEPSSTSGAPSLEASLPMAPLSESQAS